MMIIPNGGRESATDVLLLRFTVLSQEGIRGSKGGIGRVGLKREGKS